MNHSDATKPLERDTDAVASILERLSDHAMRTHAVDLAIEGYAAALKLTGGRYVTPRAPGEGVPYV